MADAAAAPAQPSGVGLKAPAPDFASFLKQTGIQSPDEMGKELSAIEEKKKEVRKPYIEANNKLMEQNREIADNLSKMKAPADPNLVAPPAAPEPKLEPTVQAMGSLASVLAMFGSLKTRAPLTSALNSAAASMQAFHKGDKERVELERANWHDKLEEGLRRNQEEMQKYTIALEKSNFDMAKVQPQFRAIAAEYQNNTMLAQIEAGDLDAQYKVIETVNNARLKLSQLYLTDQEKREATRIHSEDRRLQIAATERAHADAVAARRDAEASRDEDRRERREILREKMETKAAADAEKVVKAGKPAERAIEVIGEMEGLLQSEWGVTGAAAYAKRPLESVTSMFTGSSGAAHQYESLARELQNILRQTEEFRYKGRTLSKEVADRDVMVRGLKFGDTGQISLDQLQHLRNMLTGQGAGFDAAPGGKSAATPPAELTDTALIADGYKFPTQKALDDYKAAKAGGR